uniref:Cytochrome b n=1 Tax=Pallaseopsis kessleri TaxID=686709 RepID=A0A1L5BW70_9CRUS|nr:cytochrome b [Pallaseopsis kessleri]APL97206.1 cytochrome b [Pallaseopsis kessleri]
MTKHTGSMNSLMKVFTGTFITLPAPANISTLWNFGSLLSLCLFIQIMSGLFLASTYSPNMDTSFALVNNVMESTDKGWFMRSLHANGASLFFVCLYLHVARGLYYSSFMLTNVWLVGTTMLLMVMATAFMGYVLPVNQMSYWGASVITNLFSEVPYLGPTLVQFIWGGLSVDNPTLMRFFTFHFFFPFIVLAMVAMHIIFLHQTGSNNPLGLSSTTNKIVFNSFLSFKDLFGAALTILVFLFIVFYYPMLLSDPENFTPADPSITPNHIQPEWYFLFAYAILRSIPNKLGGVLALLMSVMLLYTLPFTHLSKMKSSYFYPLSAMLFWVFISAVFLLTWIGAKPVEEPYLSAGQVMTMVYFSYFVIGPLLPKMWDSLTN